MSSIREMVLELEAICGGAKNLPLRRAVNRGRRKRELSPDQKNMLRIQWYRAQLGRKNKSNERIREQLKKANMTPDQYKEELEIRVKEKKKQKLEKAKQKKAERQRQSQLSLSELRQEGIIPKSPRDRDRPEQEAKPKPKPKGFRRWCVVQ